MTLLSVLLALLASPWFLLLAAFVALNQWLFVAVGACPASLCSSASPGSSGGAARERSGGGT